MNHDNPTNPLLSADHSIALMEISLLLQRRRVARLARAGMSTTVASTVLEAGEAVLKSLESYRKLLRAIPLPR